MSLKLIITCLTSLIGLNGFTQNWNEIIKATASDRAPSDLFGFSVSISGNYAIIGAFREDIDTAGLSSGFDAGAAFIFEKNGAGNWNEVQKIVASENSWNDYFGYSVSISGDYLIIGAFGEDEDNMQVNTLDEAGAAYIFERNNSGVWHEVQKIVASDRAATDKFGYSVSISGDYILIGSHTEDQDDAGGNYINNSGSAYIFERNISGTWNEIQKIVASDRSANDYFGHSVSLSIDYAIVGAHQGDEDITAGNKLLDAGAAYIFERNASGVWSEAQKIVASDRNLADNFAYSVSISGKYAIAGTFKEDEDSTGNNTMTSSGSAYIFERNRTGFWNETQKIVASDRAIADYFGHSVSISGNYAIVGAIYEDEDTIGSNTMNAAGSAYIFERNKAGLWSEAQKIITSDRASDDVFGYSVSISGDYAIIGAPGEDEDTSGSNTIEGAGSAYFFRANTSIGLIENNFNSKLLLFPNPTNGSFSIDLGENHKSVIITITDLTGRLIQSKRYYNSQLLNFDLEASNGVYQLIIETDNRKAIISLIKK